jgi:hypothetical protein
MMISINMAREEMEVSATLQRIACLGDSITAGRLT